MPGQPTTPADPRPNDEPYYIDTDCPNCGTPLVLWDRMYPTDGPIWHDEWICPDCLDGCFIDAPDDQ